MVMTPQILIVGGIAAGALLGVLILWRLVRRRQEQWPEHWIVVDGSNVMFWDGNAPREVTLRKVVAVLKRQGFTPVIWFDANAGYKLSGRYEDAGRLARRAGVPKSRVLVAVKGQPADPLILDGARQLGARIVTNDRFRDWVKDFPEVSTPGHLVRGGLRDGSLWLDL